MGSKFGKNSDNFCLGHVELQVPVGHLIETILK